MDQVWYCLDCKTCGYVKYEEHEDVYSVITKVRQAHALNLCNSDPQVVLLSQMN